jgi:hypothetical protein
MSGSAGLDRRRRCRAVTRYALRLALVGLAGAFASACGSDARAPEDVPPTPTASDAGKPSPTPLPIPTASPERSPTSSPKPTAEAPDPEVALSFGALYDSSNSVRQRVLLRLSREGVEVIEPRDEDPADVRDLAPARGLAPFFSSPTVAWSLWRERSAPSLAAYMLMRSSDFGLTWEPVVRLPDDVVNSTLDLRVEPAAVPPRAWVVVTGDGPFSCPGPTVWTRRLDVEEDWTPVFRGGIGLSLGTSCGGALARRGEEIEIVAYSVGPGGSFDVRLHRLTGEGGSEVIASPMSFGWPGYVVRGERGWIFGIGPSVLHSAAIGALWEVLPATTEHVAAADFRDDGSGYACGRGFCLATRDGDRDWEAGSLPPSIGDATGIHAVTAMAEETGWALYEGDLLEGGLLRTDDGGATWEEVELPIAPTLLRFGRFGRNSHPIP